VIGADMTAPVAALLETKQRTAMAARIVEGSHHGLAVAHHQDVLPSNPGGQEIMRTRNLRFVTEENPRAFEDVAHLEIKDRGIAQGIAVNAEDAVIRPIVNQRVNPARSNSWIVGAGRPGAGACMAVLIPSGKHRIASRLGADIHQPTGTLRRIADTMK
jgi:hypothetical protein